MRRLDKTTDLLEVNEEPFTIISILGSEPFYFYTGQMYRELKLDFERVKDFEFYDESTKKLFKRPTCLYLDKENGLLFLLISNKEPLIKNFNKPSMLLFIIGRDCLIKSGELIKEIKNLSGIWWCENSFYSENNQEDSLQKEIIPSLNIQLDVFAQEENVVYNRIKNKRTKITKSSVFKRDVINNLKADLTYNLARETTDMFF